MADTVAVPGAAQRRILHARQQRGVLQGDARLVIEAVQDPGLHLAAPFAILVIPAKARPCGRLARLHGLCRHAEHRVMGKIKPWPGR